MAGGAFWTWLTTASTVSGPPGWLVGGVVGLGVAAYWYANHNSEGEQGFLDQTGNEKPSVGDFNSLRFELEQYDPAAASQIDINDWDGSWGGLFALQDTLLNSQQTFVGRMDACIASGVPMLPVEQHLYDQATASILLAEQAGAAEEGNDSAIEGESSTFPNQQPDTLQKELDFAEQQGVVPLRPDDPEFADLVAEGEDLIWAVDQHGNLTLAPNSVNHTVLTGGEPVISAGEINVVEDPDNPGEYIVIEINNSSGHFRPSEKSLEDVREIFGQHGFRWEF